MSKEITVKCPGCKKELEGIQYLQVSDCYGVYRGQTLVEGVCLGCYDDGVRSPYQEKQQKARKS